MQLLFQKFIFFHHLLLSVCDIISIREELQEIWGAPVPLLLSQFTYDHPWAVGPLDIPRMADMCDMPALVRELKTEKAVKALKFIRKRTKLFLSQGITS